MVVLRSIAFWLLATLLTLGIAIAGIVTLPLHRDVTYRWCVQWARALLWLMRVLCGLGCRVTGNTALPPGRVIFALKHQSAWETIAFPALAPPISGVLKRELLVIPIYGWYMRRLGMMPIEVVAGAPAPWSLIAVTLKKYVVPLVSPLTSLVNAVDALWMKVVNGPPALVAYSTL